MYISLKTHRQSPTCQGNSPMAASSPPTILLLLSLLLLLLSILLLPRTPQLQFPTTVFGAGDKHASVRDKMQIPKMKKNQMRKVGRGYVVAIALTMNSISSSPGN